MVAGWVSKWKHHKCRCLAVNSAFLHGGDLTKSQQVQLTDKEMALVREIAERDGITEDEAASQLVQREIAQRMNKRTSRSAAKVIAIGKPK